MTAPMITTRPKALQLKVCSWVFIKKHYNTKNENLPRFLVVWL
jgi:hypothetical protein